MRNQNHAYVQAKLNAISDEDQNTEGKGVAESQVILYRVSEPLKDNSKKDRKGKVKVVQTPSTRLHVKFYLNESFLRTQEKKLT